MISINILGLKNYRIFDDKDGILEELSNINILTGANNSGKSSIIKFFQLLKNSQGKFPFELDLTEQQHLLGDFKNILNNKNNDSIVISLPFQFLGLKNLYVNLTHRLDSINTYKTVLRKIEILDRVENEIIFSFSYRKATDDEIKIYNDEYDKKLEKYKQRKLENKSEKKSEPSFLDYYNSDLNFISPLFHSPLEGYLEWKMKPFLLKNYLSQLFDFYKWYQENKNKYKDIISTLDNKSFINDEIYFIPSLFLKSIKEQVINIDKWKKFNSNIDDNILEGKMEISLDDFQEDYPYPRPKEEDILYYKSLEIIEKRLVWNDENESKKYSVIKDAFENSWNILKENISQINYLSNIKETNSRIYNYTSNTPFIKVLNDYYLLAEKSSFFPFLNKYLNKFNIGKSIEVKLHHKYQLMSVNVIKNNDTKQELVDFGYGIKQLILILIQIKVLSERNKSYHLEFDEYGDEKEAYTFRPSILLIEEPETNLHPKWQSLLAEMFIEANNKFNIQFIIETHSEYLIRKMQNLVADGQIEGKEIKIFYLRNYETIKKNKKQLDVVPIEDDGSIDFKIFDEGFFDENDILELSLLNIQRNNFLTDFEELKIKSEEDSDTISELEGRIDDFTKKNDISEYRKNIENKFGTTNLDDLSLKYLTSGQFLLNTIPDTADFSPVIIQYGRAIENTLKTVFSTIISPNGWMLGNMQGSLEEIFQMNTGMVRCSNQQLPLLRSELINYFDDFNNLKISLLNNIREVRNMSGHSGQTKNKSEALSYISEVESFLNTWINEMK
ncbi:AAA family ATPase [Tenacibaculum sp. XPcli2-G]|uniref:AAA family ATPase n=1 Tax=Tenacibaculum sp. XPcli2-G TaxID=2954503 RepID=UPI00209723ED|nr:AAA family ATPase [Tenacibaculum sp. XPcli2-G]MCO7186090.1 AAA family ATPase [Tenacibaculum sp. XPcli2-G]